MTKQPRSVVLGGHPKGAECVAFSPDGKLCTLQGEDGRIQIHDLDNRRLLRTLESRDVWHVFSPNGKLLATTDEKNITRIWNVASGRLLKRLVGRRDEEGKFGRTWYYPLAFSLDGNLLATGSYDDGNHYGLLALWDVAKGEERLPTDDHFAAVTCVAFAANGKTLASGSVDHTVHLWDPAGGRHLRRFTGHKKRIDAVALSPRGRFLASSGQDKTLRLWDAHSGRQLHCLDAPKHGALSLVFLADDKTLQWWSSDGEIRRYDAVSGKLIRRFRSRRGVFYSAPLGPNGLSESFDFLQNDNDHEDVVWPKDLLPALPRWENAIQMEDPVMGFPTFRHVRVSADGRMAATVQTTSLGGLAGPQCRIRVWEIATGGLIADLEESNGTSRSLAFSLDGWGLFSSHKGWGISSGADFQGWDLIARKPVHRFQTPLAELNCPTVSADGRKLACGGDDAAVYIWDSAGLFRPPAAPPLSPADLQQQGNRLHDGDAAAAYRAMYRLAQSPEQSVPFLYERLRKLALPVPQLQPLFADLDADDFAVRQRASKTLAHLGPSIESALRREREKSASLEVRRRIDLLLEKLNDRQCQQYTLAVLRGITVLERIGTARARATLGKLAKISSDSDVSKEAQAALARLSHHPIRPR